MDYAGLGLPVSVMSKVEWSSLEEVGLAVLRRGLPDLPVLAKVPPAPSLKLPMLQVYRGRSLQWWSGDPRFVDSCRLVVAALANGPDAELKCEALMDAARVVLRDAAQSNLYLPGLGSVCKAKMLHDPVRSPDWETSAGPVQFADLPQGLSRYTADFQFEVRKPRTY